MQRVLSYMHIKLHLLCSCISNLTNLISSIYQISCRKCILNKLENYISINYTIMTRWFFLSLSSPFSLLFPLFSSSLRICPGAAGAAQGRSLKTLHKYELKALAGLLVHTGGVNKDFKY